MKLAGAAPFFGHIPCIFADSEPHLTCSLANQHSDDIALLVWGIGCSFPPTFCRHRNSANQRS
jgi:hypothetical protein